VITDLQLDEALESVVGALLRERSARERSRLAAGESAPDRKS